VGKALKKEKAGEEVLLNVEFNCASLSFGKADYLESLRIYNTLL
jgi:hypothetical protein